jgi:signal peptidase
MRSIRIIRRSLLVVWSLLMVGLLATVAFSHAVSLSGRQTYIINGGSMEPTIPLGSVVAVANVELARIAPGDVVTLKDGDRPVFTHRVIDVRLDEAGARSFVTQGDANAFVDADPVPAQAILGRVEFHVPVLGFLLAMLSAPTGILSVLSGMASVLMAIKLLEDDERDAAGSGDLAVPPTSGHHPHLPALPHLVPDGGQDRTVPPALA